MLAALLFLVWLVERRSLVVAVTFALALPRLLLSLRYIAARAPAPRSVWHLDGGDAPEPRPGLLGGAPARGPPLCLRRLRGGNPRGRVAGGGAARRHQPAPARHLRPHRDQRHRDAGGHLLRCDVRRLDHVHPHADPRGGGVGDDMHRRLRHGPQGTRRCRAGHRGRRLLHRGHGERGCPHAARAPACRLRPPLRPARVLRPAPPRAPRARVHERRLHGQVAGHGRARAAPGNDRHRPDERVLPILLRYRRARRRPGRGSYCRRALRHRGGAGHGGAGSAASGAQAQAARAPALAPGMARVRAADRARDGSGLPHRHHSGLRPHHLELRLLRRGAPAEPSPRGVRRGRGSRGGGSGIGEQRRDLRSLRAHARPRRPLRAHPRRDAGRPHGARRLAGAAPHQRAARALLGLHRLDVRGQPHPARPQPAHGGSLRERIACSLLPPLPVDHHVLRGRRVRGQRQRGRRLDRHRHGRPGLWAEEARLRDRPHRARRHPRSHARAGPEAIAGHVGRSVRDLRLRPISGTLLAFGASLVLLNLVSWMARSLDWRQRIPHDEKGENL
jgi:hypothetical protein